MINRRDFLKNASLFTLGGLMAGKVGSADAAKPVTSETMAAKTVGLQIYSLGKELYADVPGGLKKIKQMGYTNLELAGYKEGKIGGVDMMEFKKMVDDAGEMSSWYVLNAIGLYTYSPADPEYIVTVPLFDKVTFNLNGRPFTIVKKGSGKKIIDITYDGKKIDGYFITHDQLREGKELVITTE